MTTHTYTDSGYNILVGKFLNTNQCLQRHTKLNEMEKILRSELETADKRIATLQSTIKIQDKIIQAMDERIELMKKTHQFQIDNYYTKNTEL